MFWRGREDAEPLAGLVDNDLTVGLELVSRLTARITTDWISWAGLETSCSQLILCQLLHLHVACRSASASTSSFEAHCQVQTAAILYAKMESVAGWCFVSLLSTGASAVLDRPSLRAFVKSRASGAAAAGSFNSLHFAGVQVFRWGLFARTERQPFSILNVKN